ncbi:hypothetical protein HY621_01945 [Candidatus Uhrbacteria bacterium]|nr:hypothetical protein [Candidatus Uhrbacteria bacterium]
MTLSRSELPADYYDHWQSEPYARCMEKYGWRVVGGTQRYGFVRRMGPFLYAKYLYTDEAPRIEEVRERTKRHGMISWTPWRRMDMPSPWRPLSSPFFPHDWRSGFARVRQEYQTAWSQRARRNLRKCISSGIQMRQGTVEEYCNSFRKGLIPHSLKGLVIQKIQRLPKENLVSFLAQGHTGVIGGLCVFRYDHLSSHISSSLTQEGKESNVGTGCIDAWVRWALDEKIKYLNFGGVWTDKDPKEWQGFSEFKRNFIDYEVAFNDAYYRFF